MPKKTNNQESAMTSDKGGGVAAVERAFAILGAFDKDGTSLSLAEISEITGMYKSTILRLMDSLLRYGYMQRLQDGRYQIGPTPLMLGARFQRGIRIGDVVLPLMRLLAEETHESVAFYVVHGTMRLCLHRIESDHEVRDHGREGDVFPMARGSGGGVLSAFSGARGERYEAIRKDYYYISLGERSSETAGISVPVFGAGQRLIGSLTISGPRSRVGEAFLNKARARLLEFAVIATVRFGGDAHSLNAAAEGISRRTQVARVR